LGGSSLVEGDEIEYNDFKESNPATITINVTEVNDAPISSDINTTINEDTDAIITLSCTDVDNVESDFTYTITGEPSNGDYELSGNQLTYTPNAE